MRMMSVCPFLTYSLTASAVWAPSHAAGPTCDCQTSRYGCFIPILCITVCTVAATSAGYGSPLLTTLMGRLCAENSSMTLSLLSGGYSWRVFSMFVANASTRPGCTGQRSMTLHFMLPDAPASASTPARGPSSLFRHFHSSLRLDPVVLQLYCGYCVNATALPPFP